MDTDIEIERIGDYLIRVVLDETPPSPRDYDCLAKMVLYHRNYDLPNDVDYLREYIESLTWAEIEQELQGEEYGARVMLPVFMSEYSGAVSTRSASRDSDNSQIGFIFATESQIREWHMLAPDAPITPEIESIVEEGLRGEVAEYDSWARGDCYGYIIETAVTTYKVEPSDDNLMGSAHIVAIPPGETVDSCWGFIGDADYCMSEARSAAGGYV